MLQRKAHNSFPTLPTPGVTGALAEPKTPSPESPKRPEEEARTASPPAPSLALCSRASLHSVSVSFLLSKIRATRTPQCRWQV